MIEVNFNPTTKDVRIFGGLILLFFGLVGGVVLWRPEGLLVAAMILGGAWIVSLLFNSRDRGRQLAGIVLPGLFALAGGAVRLGTDPGTVAYVLWGVGALLALMTWISLTFGCRLYVGWMLAAVPIGWTISHIVLGAVYYLVLTPIGLIMRLVGRDPTHIRREPQQDPSRPFRQF
jgi:hypothetical protein